MRIAVTGKTGQVVSALIERAAAHNATVISCGRPELDLANRVSVIESLTQSAPDLIISAAAYTAVDLAEEESALAFAVNADGAGHVAEAAASLKVPLIHLSTDHVFDGTKGSAYREDDPVSPLNVYGKSKLAGEHSVQNRTSNHAILRTAWVYSALGKNFLKTIAQLAADRPAISVVGDQVGAPTSALDVAEGIFSVAANLLTQSTNGALRGTFHMTAGGAVSWAAFAAEIMACLRASGMPTATIEMVTTTQFGAKAARPANSALNCEKLAQMHGVRLPQWSDSVGPVVARLARQQLT